MKQFFFHICGCPTQNQFFLCSGHGNIQHTQFLGLAFLLHLLLKCFFQKGRRLNSEHRIHRIDTHSQFRVYNNTLLDILHIKLLAHTDNKDNRELQSLTFMNAHQIDNIHLIVHQTGLAVVNIIFLQLLNITNKVEETLVTGALKCHSLFYQHFQIRRTLLSTRKGRCIIHITGIVQQSPKQCMNLRIWHLLTIMFIGIQKSTQALPNLGMFSIFSICADTLVECLFCCTASNDCQLLT